MSLRSGIGWRRDLGLRLLSVLLALLLWLFVQGARVVDREMDLPIHYVGLPDSLRLLEPGPSSVRVLVSGPAQEVLLRPMLLQQATVRVDLTRARAPRHSVSLSPRDVDVPAHARIAVVRFLDPAVFELRLERQARTRPAAVSPTH